MLDDDGRVAQIESRLLPVTGEIPEDLATGAAVTEWVDRAYQGFRDLGFEPTETVVSTAQALDGREALVRHQATNLTDLIARALLSQAPGADLAVYNSGSIRIDDVLPRGPVTQYDIIRVLPFGGAVVVAEVRGSLLGRLLDQGAASAGTGAYLQTANVERSPDGEHWLIAQRPLEPEHTYRLVTIDYLSSGREQGMDFFSPENPDLRILATRGDIRVAVIEELRRQAR